MFCMNHSSMTPRKTVLEIILSSLLEMRRWRSIKSQLERFSKVNLKSKENSKLSAKKVVSSKTEAIGNCNVLWSINLHENIIEWLLAHRLYQRAANSRPCSQKECTALSRLYLLVGRKRGTKILFLCHKVK